MRPLFWEARTSNFKMSMTPGGKRYFWTTTENVVSLDRANSNHFLFDKIRLGGIVIEEFGDMQAITTGGVSDI